MLQEEYPTSEVVVTGHSLGGALCTLCAYDLLHSVGVDGEAPIRQQGGVTLVSFAAPRMFNRAFQEAMEAMRASSKLAALR